MQHWPESDIWGSRPLPHDARTQHWECPHSIPESARIQRFYCVLHSLKRYQGNKVDSLGVHIFNVAIVFYTLWNDIRVNKVDSLGVPTFKISLVFYTLSNDITVNKIDSLRVPTFNVSIVFYTLWVDAGQQSWFPGSAHIQRFYCVSHALRGCRATKLTPWECPHSTFLLCFTRFEWCRATKLGPWECPYSTFLLCLTRFERMLGNKVGSLGVTTFNVSIVFNTLWVDAG